MSATFVWSIQSMECKKMEGSYIDVVIKANWVCAGFKSTFTATSSGVATFPAPSGSFTPYDQLTQEQVLNWCWSNGVDKNAVQVALEAGLDAQIAAPNVTLPPPWQTT